MQSRNPVEMQSVAVVEGKTENRNYENEGQKKGKHLSLVDKSRTITNLYKQQ